MPDSEETDRVFGWYPAADDPTREMYWNGFRWSGRTRASDPDVEREQADDLLTNWGIGMSLLVPLIGLYLGAVLIAQGRRIRSGVGIMLLALVMTGVWAGVAVYAIDKQAESAIQAPIPDDSSSYDDYGY